MRYDLARKEQPHAARFDMRQPHASMTPTIQPLPRRAPRGALRVAAYVVLSIAVVVQLGSITQYWWDPPLCDQRLDWQHYVDYINGRFHREIVGAIEVVAGTWLVAGVAGLLGRFVPPYLSVWLPAALFGVTVMLANDYWDHRSDPEDTLAYWKLVSPWLACWCAPAIGAWMAGVSARPVTADASRDMAPTSTG
jgi:hypothetical protein